MGEHANKFIEYGLMRGAKMSTPDVGRPDDSKWETLNACQIVSMTLALEQKVNDALLKLHACADGNGVATKADPQFQDFLEGNFLNEQVEAAKELADLLTTMERSTQHLNKDGKKIATCDGLGLHIIDNGL